MKNWKDYVGLQLSEHDAESGERLSKFLVVNKEEKYNFFISLVDIVVLIEEYKYTEDDVGDIVESALMEFPKWDKPLTEECGLYNIGLQIARQTRRGMGETKFTNGKTTSIFYTSKKEHAFPITEINKYDAPLVVSEYKGKYAVVKHPDFEKYGFVVEEEE